MDMVVSIWPPPGVESVRVEQVQMVARARHRDVEQAALLVDLLWCPGRHVRRYAAVNHVEHIHHIPFLALSGMDRREDEIVFVEVRIGGYIPHCVGWVERQLAQEPLARRVARGALRSTERTALTCAASGNLRPPYLTNGMLRRPSSTSSRSE